MKAIRLIAYSFIPFIIMIVYQSNAQAAEKSQIYIGWSCKDIVPDSPLPSQTL